MFDWYVKFWNLLILSGIGDVGISVILISSSEPSNELYDSGMSLDFYRALASHNPSFNIRQSCTRLSLDLRFRFDKKDLKHVLLGQFSA